MGMIQMMDSLDRIGDTTLKINIYSEPMQVKKEMIDGTADFAVLPTTMAAVLYNKGLDYCVIAIPTWGTLYLIGNDSDHAVKGWNDLKGQTIHVMAKGMTPDLLFRYLLKQNGLQPDQEVTLDYRFPMHNNLASAVSSGRAKFGIISEPYASLVMQQNPKVHVLLDLDAEWSKVQGVSIAETALLCKKDLVKTHPELVSQIISQYAKSAIWVNAHRQEAAKLIVNYNIMPDTSSVIKAIPRSNLKVMDARSCKNNITRYLKVFYDMNPQSIGGKMPDEKFIY